MKDSLNFPLLFDRIRNYLAKGPRATPEELEAAKEAFNLIVATIYAGHPNLSCPVGHPALPTL